MIFHIGHMPFLVKDFSLICPYEILIGVRVQIYMRDLRVRCYPGFDQYDGLCAWKGLVRLHLPIFYGEELRELPFSNEDHTFFSYNKYGVIGSLHLDYGSKPDLDRSLFPY